MIRAHSDSTSNSATTPTPFSPFSSAFSIGSDATGTSEEPGDLGAFTTVFRALTQLQRQHQIPPPPSLHLDYNEPVYTTESDADGLAGDSTSFRSSSNYSSSDDEDVEEDDESSSPPETRDGSRSTVWSQAPVASYLTTTDLEDVEGDGEGEGPSLGALESALLFLAKERERLTTKLDLGIVTTGSDWTSGRGSGGRTSATGKKNNHGGAASRKGRKERRKGRNERRRQAEEEMDGDESRTETAAEVSSSNDSPDGPLSKHARNNITPIFRQPKRGKRPTSSTNTSTQVPNLIPTSAEATALQMHLTSLAMRLSEQFPSDSRALKAMTFDSDRLVAGAASFILSDRIEKEGFFDPRGELNANGMAEGAKVHVFVDHSNILVGFLEWIKRQPFTPSSGSNSIPLPGTSTPYSNSQFSSRPLKPKLSHASLILLLERGRHCGKRVLVASSPLHQGVDDIVEMGYEVSVLQRVAIKEGSSGLSTPNGSSLHGNGRYKRRNQDPSLLSSGSPLEGQGGSGGSSTESAQSQGPLHLLPLSSPMPQLQTSQHLGHRRYPSAPSTLSSSSFSSFSSSTSAQSANSVSAPTRNGYGSRPAPYPLVPSVNSSGPGGGHSFESNVSPGPMYGSASSTSTSSHYGSSNPSNSAPSRPRFREEAVDELLQLKLLQVLVASTDKPPRGSTIVLATGDGASSQFNREGFLGCVKQAVERGWRVELVGWEEGRSRAWGELAWEINAGRKRGDVGSRNGGLYMISLEKWGWDLLDSTASSMA